MPPALGMEPAWASLLSFSTKARWSLSCLRSAVTSGLLSQAEAAAALAGGAGTRVWRACSDCCAWTEGEKAAISGNAARTMNLVMMREEFEWKFRGAEYG